MNSETDMKESQYVIGQIKENDEWQLMKNMDNEEN